MASTMPEYGSISTERRPADQQDPELGYDDELALDKNDIPIPSALSNPHALATPLPIVPMTVLSITVMGEFLCANVSTPFLLFMVREFGIAEDEASVGYWTGILVSVFFLTQFATSLLWASLAEIVGRRAALFISLLGSTITCIAFGTQHTFSSALCMRLVQGVFAGAIGVARSSVAVVTDVSNEGRAYAIMGFAWGLGGVIGAVIGGTFESPATKWPSVFGRIMLLRDHPYLLPCAMAASVTFTGAILCLFLDPDGLPRKQASPLVPRDPEQIIIQPSISPSIPPTTHSRPPPPTRLDSHASSASRASHTSDRSALVVTFASSHLPPISSPTIVPRRRSSAATGGLPLGQSLRMRRRSSAATHLTHETTYSIAERFLAANENQVTSLAELWVAAAISTDNALEENAVEFESDDEVTRSTSPEPLSPGATGMSEHQTLLRHPATLPIDPPSSAPLVPAVRRISSTMLHRSRTMSSRAMSSGSARRFPTIFENAGVQGPLDLPDTFYEEDEDIASVATEIPVVHDDILEEDESVNELSALQQVPKLIILQYGLLALHTTTHDQIFYSYLMSKFESGGLGLDPGQFSQLIAIMSMAQVVYQFWMYPTVGPPRGSLSHLAMFRMGSLLFIPSYMTVVLYRSWNQSLVMPGLIASTALRYCATTFRPPVYPE